MVQHQPLLTTENHCEKPKKIFDFQIGHIEIGKVTKFGVIWRLFWGLRADLQQGVLNTPPSQIGLRSLQLISYEKHTNVIPFWNSQDKAYLSNHVLGKYKVNPITCNVGFSLSVVGKKRHKSTKINLFSPNFYVKILVSQKVETNCPISKQGLTLMARNFFQIAFSPIAYFKQPT